MAYVLSFVLLCFSDHFLKHNEPITLHPPFLGYAPGTAQKAFYKAASLEIDWIQWNQG